ncbi:MAG TPA: endonuclease/exonuclease/phosphatase family protein [Candidatus Hydrogenedentes bacterium]|nr:endonuclease/exonuclease/phosphatase family protein [Candidatus Hydrogenedentota bacterium]
MKRILTTFLAASALTISAFAEIDITVMSFNLRFGTANDGPNHWDKRKEMVAETVRMYNPAIVGTQECLDFQADFLVESLPEYRWFGVGREEDCTSEHMAVLYQHKIVVPIDSGTFWLSETPNVVGSISWDSACRRTVTWAKFYHIASKSSFYFLNTHLDHKSEPARVGGARVISEYIAKLPADLPIILTGDFNAIAENSEAYSILTGSGMSDAWLTASEKVGPAVTWGAFKAPDLASNRRIDWILSRGKVSVAKCETVVFNKDGRYPSDHFPVVATLKLGN